METYSQTALREDAISLLDEMSEEKLMVLVKIMRNMNKKPLPAHKRGENSEAFRRLEQLCLPIPNLDEKKELAEWREEKFGNASAN